jgi:hypothetical protein
MVRCYAKMLMCCGGNSAMVEGQAGWIGRNYERPEMDGSEVSKYIKKQTEREA